MKNKKVKKFFDFRLPSYNFSFFKKFQGWILPMDGVFNWLIGQVGQMFGKQLTLPVQILLLLTIVTLAPSIILTVTCFVRILVVLSFVRHAVTHGPPQQVITALALFLTFFIMAPTINKINNEAIRPYIDGKITYQETFSIAIAHLRNFMFNYTRQKDLDLFLSAGNFPRPKNRDEIPTYVLIPAFMMSELTCAFQMGILLLLPFLVIDMVVASILMSMGMIMLPPTMLSLPFKVLLFVLVDGWHLVVNSLIKSL